MTESPFVNWEQATAFVSAEPDKAVRQLLSLAIGTITRQHVAQDNVPARPVDALYLVRLLRELFKEKDAVQAILEGRHAGEWSPNDT
jgi:hypothetical protein